MSDKKNWLESRLVKFSLMCFKSNLFTSVMMVVCVCLCVKRLSCSESGDSHVTCVMFSCVGLVRTTCVQIRTSTC